MTGRSLMVGGLALAVMACSGPTATTPRTDTPVVAPFTTPPLPAGLSPLLESMLLGLGGYLTSVRADLQASAPNNPSLSAYYQAKLSMLSSPTLIQDVVNGRRWVEGQASTSRGAVPIAAVFPLESMRVESTETVRASERYLSILVDYFEEAFPTGTLKIWYGFKIGMSGGGGAMYLEDRGTYDQRRTGSGTIFAQTLAHELAHSYIGNEALTQFLELHVYNTDLGLGTDPTTWAQTRGWSPTQATSFGVTYALDIYHRVGPDVMRRAFRAVRPLRPAYGQPLTQAVIAAFLAEVPAEHRAYVQERLAQILA